MKNQPDTLKSATPSIIPLYVNNLILIYNFQNYFSEISITDTTVIGKPYENKSRGRELITVITVLKSHNLD